ncbi:hypothetical protein TNCV_2888861 [Trichonephila clavipes]|nr:hypothetical protein TNCV_2888861 [Trichonephila clavipes]
MDIFKCIVPSRHRGTLNNRRAASPLVSRLAASSLVRLVEGEAPAHPQDVLPQNWGETELNRSVTWLMQYLNFGRRYEEAGVTVDISRLPGKNCLVTSLNHRDKAFLRR